MAELADALHLGCSGEILEGSSPFIDTEKYDICCYMRDLVNGKLFGFQPKTVGSSPASRTHHFDS